MNDQQADLYRRIEEFTLDEPGADFPFTARLSRENGWSLEYANRVVQEYKRFVFLAVAAGHSVTPSDQVDQAWHLHLTYTRSYWTRFCPEVLGKPLHHNPTQGGAAEQSKFHDWYDETLESYEQFFGSAPPRDIWPEAGTRFGSDLDHRRVNISRNWIILKHPLKWIGAISVLILLTVCVATGCSMTPRGDGSRAVGLPASMFGGPFNLDGPEFLKLFIVMFACAMMAAMVLRWLFRRTDRFSPHEIPDLDPYEVAYLACGDERALHAMLASLVGRRVLALDTANRRLIPAKSDSEKDSWHVAEEAVLKTINDEAVSLDEFMQTRWSWLTKVADRLKSLDLVVSDERDLIGRLVPTLLVLLVPVMGAIKIFVGVSRDRPVGFLVVACIVATAVTIAVFTRRLHRTSQGDRVLSRLKSEHDGFGHALDESAPSSVPLAVGLLGIDVLAGGPHEELQTALKVKDKSSGFFGCGGGGCGGGGCGGCGGCG